jgi:hypothetical protein
MLERYALGLMEDVRKSKIEKIGVLVEYFRGYFRLTKNLPLRHDLVTSVLCMLDLIQ